MAAQTPRYLSTLAFEFLVKQFQYRPQQRPAIKIANIARERHRNVLLFLLSTRSGDENRSVVAKLSTLSFAQPVGQLSTTVEPR